jgi:hypothetical protein
MKNQAIDLMKLIPHHHLYPETTRDIKTSFQKSKLNNEKSRPINSNSINKHETQFLFNGEVSSSTLNENISYP